MATREQILQSLSQTKGLQVVAPVQSAPIKPAPVQSAPDIISAEEATTFFNEDAPDTIPADQADSFFAEEVSQETPEQKKEGFFKGLYNDTVGANFIKPAVRLGELAGVGLVKAFGSDENYQRALDITGQEKQAFGATVSGVKPIDEGGAFQIAGEGLVSASNLITGGTAGSIASKVFKAPVMKTVSNLAVAGGIGGGLYGAGSGLQKDDPTLASVAKDTGTAVMVGTLLGGGLGLAGAGVAKGLQKVAPKSANIMQRMVKLTNKQETKFKQMTGEDVGEFLSKRDLNLAPEEIVQESTQRFINSYQEADNALAQLPGVYKTDPVKTALDDLVQREIAISTPGTKSANSETINALVKKYDEGGLTMSEINQVKRIYEKEVKLPYMKENNSLQVERSGRIDSAIREWQLQKADDLGFKNLRDINKQTQAYKFLADKIADRISGGKTNNALSLTDAVLLAGGDPQAIAMFATRRFFGSAKVQALVARISRDKNLDVEQVKALFGGVKGLPAKIPGVDYNIKKPTQLPRSAREFNLGLNEIKNAKQGQLLSQELLELPYTKDMMKKEASQVVDILKSIDDKEKSELLDILRINNFKLYKEVKENFNKELFDKYQMLKNKPMSERMQSIYEPYTPVEDLPVIPMGNTPKKVDTSGLPEIQMNDKSYVRPKLNKQAGFISTGGKESLVATHNISIEKLLKANKQGGFANPSMAIFDSEHGFSNFGEISLIGNKNLISKGKTFASDVYSPRYPRVEVFAQDLKPIENVLKRFEKETGDYIYNLDKDNIVESLLDSPLAKASYLDSKGIEIPKVLDKDGRVNYYDTKKALQKVIDDKQLYPDYVKHATEIAQSGNMKERIWTGSDKMGRNKYVPNTLENASKVMNKEKIRGGENFFPSLGSIRANVSKELKTLKSIKDNKELLKTGDEFTKIREIYEKTFDDVVESLSKYGNSTEKNTFIKNSVERDGISNYLATGNKNELSYSFKDIPESELQKLDDIKVELQSMPTEYFETKFRRPVKINEFSHAVIPNDTPKEVLDILDNNNIKYTKYKTGDDAERLRIIKELKDNKQIDTFGKVGLNPLTVGAGATAAIAGGMSMTKDKKE